MNNTKKIFGFIIKLSFILYIAENEVNAHSSAEPSPLERAEAFLKVLDSNVLEKNPSIKVVLENIDLLNNEQVPLFEQTGMACEILEKKSPKVIASGRGRKSNPNVIASA
jgi:hypothetical protein